MNKSPVIFVALITMFFMISCDNEADKTETQESKRKKSTINIEEPKNIDECLEALKSKLQKKQLDLIRTTEKKYIYIV